MNIFQSHPLLSQLGEMKRNLVSEKQIVLDSNEQFMTGTVVNGVVQDGSARSTTASPMVYTSMINYVQNIEAFVYVDVEYSGTLTSIEVRSSQDGITFDGWKSVNAGEMFEDKNPFFQVRITMANGSLDKVTIGFNEKIPNMAEVLKTLNAANGQSDADFDVALVYDAKGNVIEERYSGGIQKTIRYGYDETNQVIMIETELADKVIRQSLSYDAEGNVTGIGMRTERKNGNVFKSEIQYNADPIRVNDIVTNNTIRLSVNTGGGETTKIVESFVLDGIKMPDRLTPEGAVAWQALANKLFGKQPNVTPKQKDSNNRWKAVIIVDGENINDWLVANGYATRL